MPMHGLTSNTPGATGAKGARPALRRTMVVTVVASCGCLLRTWS
uniref:Uncharacterized protein n=1 Tax=Zea mays TaxID=4577 RepID=B4FNJ5_MAIZE|nr:unknown [Zea mays]